MALDINELLLAREYIGQLVNGFNPATGALSPQVLTLDNGIKACLERVGAVVDTAITDLGYDCVTGKPIQQPVSNNRKTKAALRDAPKKQTTKPRKKAQPIPTQCEVYCRGAYKVIPVEKKQMQLTEIHERINEYFNQAGIVVSINRLQAMLKEKNILQMGKALGQVRLIPTKLGEYYGVSLATITDDNGVSKSIPVYNERGQYFIYSSLSEAKKKKVPFAYIEGLIKAVPVTKEEISISELINRINDVYINEQMTKLTYDAVSAVLAEQGVIKLNPDGTTPKYVPEDGMRRNGIVFYPADARHSARTSLTEKGQRFVLRMLSVL